MLTQAPAPSPNPLHAALTGILSDLKTTSHAKTIGTTTKGNWRTGPAMRHLHKIKSIPEVMSYEDEFRGVIDSQESRARVKILHACLHGQCLLDEWQLVWEEEKRDRLALESMAVAVLSRMVDMGTIIGHEMYFRHLIMRDFFIERYHERINRDAFYISIQEYVSRQQLMEVETLERRETEQRRFLAVGREINMELLRQKTHRITLWAQTTASNFYHLVSILSAEEERDRISLERLYMLKLSLIANDEENSAARLVTISVMRASLLRRRLNDDAAQRALAERLLMIPLKEADTRNLIEKVEMEKRQELRVSFFLSWRAAFKKVVPPGEGAEIVERLELYERLCVFDQWRYGLNALDERHYYERRAIAKRDAEFENFYSYVVEELTALWNQEGEAFNCLRKQYSDFEWSQRVLQTTDVLQTEEVLLRQRVAEGEVCHMIKLLVHYRLGICEYAEAQQASILVETESHHRALLAHQFGDEMWERRFNELENEEFSGRSDIEALSNAGRAEIDHSESAARGETMELLAARAETVRQEFAFVQQRRRELCAAIAALEQKERAKRREAELEQQRGRYGTYAFILSLAEIWNRCALRAEEEYERVALQCCNTVHREEIERGFILQSEAQRRGFLVESMDYAHPFLRACEVDELEERMDIIHLAELTNRTLAYTHGLDRHVSYCSEELRTRHAATRFMSTEELLQQLGLELVGAVEPLKRKEISNLEERDRFVLTLTLEESIGRLRIEEIASDAQENLHALFDRLISRDDQWRTRGAPREPLMLSSREVLLRYFNQIEASAAQQRRAQLEKARQSFGKLFQDFYWTRDAVVLQEFIARESLSSAFHRKQFPRSFAEMEPTVLALRLYNLTIMSDDLLGSLVLKMWDSKDGAGLTCDLHEAQTISTAGGAFYVFFPTHPMEWMRPVSDDGHVFYFEVRDNNGVLVTTASYFLRRDALVTEVSLLSIPMDGCMGKMNAVLYVR